MLSQPHYAEWRNESLTSSWRQFSDVELSGKDILDFGSGDGHLSFLLASKGQANSITGVEIDRDALARANANLKDLPQFSETVNFVEGSVEGLPAKNSSIDLITAFDCLEHVMEPEKILREWERVLRPGGRVLIEWFPFYGPWGPHMTTLVPVPWAHVIFGEKAMFAAAATIYDDPEFVPGHWDLDEYGNKKPNKWKQWSTFEQQGYVNQLSVRAFRKLVKKVGLKIERFDKSGFGKSGLKKALGDSLMAVPILGEYATSFAIIELEKPEAN